LHLERFAAPLWLEELMCHWNIKNGEKMHEALLYEKCADGNVRCHLCRHRCLIAAGRRGICGVRENDGGTLRTLVYGRLVTENVDPVEKKPLFHFQPGSLTYSIATVGCNFRCLHCQNYSISQVPTGMTTIPGNLCSPEDVVRRAVASGCRSISYTYTEPTIFFEFALDTARLAREAGLSNIFVTNGYMTPEALDLIAPYLDAANIDLKGFSDRYYHEIAGAELHGVLETIRDFARRGIWVELTTLLIPGWNDAEDELDALVRFVVDELGADIPWHVSRFFPTYRLTDCPATPVETLHRAAAVGRKAGLSYIYLGNTPQPEGEDTVCSGCHAPLVSRTGFHVTYNGIKNDCCSRCGVRIAGVWS
jgi:pyruvate formate lyase activating enzyme